MLKQLCNQKGAEIIELEACPYHMNMLISILPKYSLS